MAKTTSACSTITRCTRKSVFYVIHFLVPYLYISSSLWLQTNASLASCRCVRFNTSGIFQSPNFLNTPLLSMSLSPSLSLPQQYSSSCLLYKFEAPDGYIVEVTFDYFHLSSRSDRLYDKTPDGLINEGTNHDGEYCAKEICYIDKANQIKSAFEISWLITANFDYGTFLLNKKFEANMLTFINIYWLTTVRMRKPLISNLKIEVGRTFFSYTKYFIFLVQMSNFSKGFRGIYSFVPKDRFESNATEVEPCRFRIDTLAGNLFSPNYPYYYPTNANCTYNLTSRRGFYLLVSLKYLNLRRSACHEDYIDIYQMFPKVHLEKLCYDSMPPYSIRTIHGYIINFHSGDNNNVKARGFHMSFEYVPQKTSDDIQNDSFNRLEKESILDLISSGPSSSSLNDRISSSNQCPIQINSPSVSGGNSRFSSITGILNSTHLIDSDDPFKCQLIFLGSGTERVQIIFLYFNLYARMPHFNNGTNRCNEVDHLSAHVLIGTRMSQIEDFCGSKTPPQLMSTKNLLTLNYIVRSTRAMRNMLANAENFGFVIQYNFRSDLGLSEMKAETRNDLTCHYEFNSSHRTSGNIFSPNHPGYYPRNIDCHYIFQGMEKQIVIIHFEYFDIEGFATCDDSTHSDYVLFSNYQTHDRTNRRYCGQTCPKDSIMSESNYFRMLFHSNDIFDATGFYAHYQFITERPFQINRVKVTNNCGAFANLCIIWLIMPLLILYMVALNI